MYSESTLQRKRIPTFPVRPDCAGTKTAEGSQEVVDRGWPEGHGFQAA
jgi:hypothetical protein